VRECQEFSRTVPRPDRSSEPQLQRNERERRTSGTATLPPISSRRHGAILNAMPAMLLDYGLPTCYCHAFGGTSVLGCLICVRANMSASFASLVVRSFAVAPSKNRHGLNVAGDARNRKKKKASKAGIVSALVFDMRNTIYSFSPLTCSIPGCHAHIPFLVIIHTFHF